MAKALSEPAEDAAGARREAGMTDRAGPPPLHGIAGHAHMRLLEHLGFDLTAAEWRGVVRDIIEGRGLLVQDGNPARRFLVKAHGRDVQLVWHRDRALVVTVLAPHCVASKGEAKRRKQKRHIRVDGRGPYRRGAMSPDEDE